MPHLGKNVPFVVMKSVFDSEKRIHKIWDLKGSKVGRKAKEGEAVFKDLDFLEQGAKLEIGPKKKNLVIEQLKKDANFLADLNIIDYSLLVGVHQRSVEREELYLDTDTDTESTRCSTSTTPDLSNLRSFASLFLQEVTGGEYVESGTLVEYDDASSGEVDDTSLIPVYSPTETSFRRLINTVSCDDLEGLHIKECLSIVDSSINVVEIAEASDDRVEVMWVTSSKQISDRDDFGVESWIVDTDTLLSKEIYYIGNYHTLSLLVYGFQC